jgi:hypothetical protein
MTYGVGDPLLQDREKAVLDLGRRDDVIGHLDIEIKSGPAFVRFTSDRDVIAANAVPVAVPTIVIATIARRVTIGARSRGRPIGICPLAPTSHPSAFRTTRVRLAFSPRTVPGAGSCAERRSRSPSQLRHLPRPAMTAIGVCHSRPQCTQHPGSGSNSAMSQRSSHEADAARWASSASCDPRASPACQTRFGRRPGPYLPVDDVRDVGRLGVPRSTAGVDDRPLKQLRFARKCSFDVRSIRRVSARGPRWRGGRGSLSV